MEKSMKEKQIYVNGLQKVETAPLWKWKGIDFPTEEPPEGKLAQFFSKSGRTMDDVVLGPGVGAGVGCGAGLGLGVVGAAGLLGSSWNDLRLAFGFGVGCGVGIGVGFAQGYGGGFSLESLKSHLFDPKSRSKKRTRF